MLEKLKVVWSRGWDLDRWGVLEASGRGLEERGVAGGWVGPGGGAGLDGGRAWRRGAWLGSGRGLEKGRGWREGGAWRRGAGLEERDGAGG